LDWEGKGWYQSSVCVGGTDDAAPLSALTSNGLILTDEATNMKYRVYIYDGKLQMEVVN
jgi:hypothetical protein